MTDDEIREMATLAGFLSGKDCGYSQEGLWVKDTDGGHTSVYPVPSKGFWTVAFFGPGQNVPFASKAFPNATLAFRYASQD